MHIVEYLLEFFHVVTLIHLQTHICKHFYLHIKERLLEE